MSACRRQTRKLLVIRGTIIAPRLSCSCCYGRSCCRVPRMDSYKPNRISASCIQTQKQKHTNTHSDTRTVTYLEIVVGREWRDHGRHGRILAFAHEIKVEHALDGSLLKTKHDAPRHGRKVLDFVVRFVVGLLWFQGLTRFWIAIRPALFRWWLGVVSTVVVTKFWEIVNFGKAQC